MEGKRERVWREGEREGRGGGEILTMYPITHFCDYNTQQYALMFYYHSSQPISNGFFSTIYSPNPPSLLSSGLVADCPLTNYTPSTCSPYTTDNDGLWTSVLVAAEAFRYQVTKDLSAKYNAWNLFRGMQFLVNVSQLMDELDDRVTSDTLTVA